MWRRFIPYSHEIWSNRYAASGGWGTESFVGSGGNWGQFDPHPQVAADASGNVTIVWYQSEGNPTLWSNRYTPGGGWGTAVPVGWCSYSSPTLAVDPTGNVTAVYTRFPGMWSSRYTASGGWGTAKLIGAGSPSYEAFPDVAVDPHGNVTAAWIGSEEGPEPQDPVVRSNRFE